MEIVKKTALNDPIIIPKQIPNDHQLYRCIKQKKFEANLLLKLPINYCFLDVGAHYGDTSLTMAIHAANNNRQDIKFFAFEPNAKKCEYIRYISKLNNLDINVYNTAVGDINCNCKNDGQVPDLNGNVTFKKSVDGNIKMITLDSLKEILNSIGYIHIDVEGNETLVLKGASKILTSNKPYIIAEYWTKEEAISRGLSPTPKQDILDEINKYDFIRQDDLIDNEYNLVFFPK